MFDEESDEMSSFLATCFSDVSTNEQILTKQAMTIPTCSVNQERKTPKDVLRETICENRKRKGQELPIIEKVCVARRRAKQPKNEEVSEEILRRREKNRKAAMKCRLKKRKIIDTLQEKVDKYENRNRELEKKIKNFEEEKMKLKKLLEGHRCTKGRQRTNNHHHDQPDFQEQSYNSFYEFSETVTQDGSGLQVLGQLNQEIPQEQFNYLIEPNPLINDEGQNISIQQFLDELPI